MKEKIKFYFDNKERILIINSLSYLKKNLLKQNLSVAVESVEEIIVKISNNAKLELDILDSKIVIKSLYEMRNDLKQNNRNYDDVHNILLKVIDVIDCKRNNIKGVISR